MLRRRNRFVMAGLCLALSGCGATGATGAVVATATQAAASLPPYTIPPDPKPRCPTDFAGTADPKSVVDATADIFAAGLDAVPQFDGGGGSLPPVWTLAATGQHVVTFADVKGCVNRWHDMHVEDYNGPNGDSLGHTMIDSVGGISGIDFEHNQMFLVGVFLTDAAPGASAPLILHFGKGYEFTDLEPLIGQEFFIGDGVGHAYRAPAGATRLFLGFADAEGFQGAPGIYSNNLGELTVTVIISPS